MEVDTGAIVSLISHETKEELFPEAKVVPSKVVLQTYTREQMEVLGVMKVHVKYGSYDGMLEQFVVEGQEPALMGHDWLQVTQLDRQGVHEAHITGGLLQKYNPLFGSDQGAMKDLTVTLTVRQYAKPLFSSLTSIVCPERTH